MSSRSEEKAGSAGFPAAIRRFLDAATVIDGVMHLQPVATDSWQDGLYIDLRRAEGRVYQDRTVQHLPEMDPRHPLAAEWRMRVSSLNRIVGYLGGLRRLITVLDLGCGNGWMSNRLAALPRCSVLGLDLNLTELRQAARVFSGRASLRFAFGDVMEIRLPSGMLDMVVLAGTLQYFSDPARLMERLCDLIAPGGEIHIMDSPFYPAGEAQPARGRSEEYYRRLGFPEMAGRYHHHTFESLSPFTPEIIHDPSGLFQWFRRVLPWIHEARFPWIRVRR